MDLTLHHARGSLAQGPYALALTPEQAGWAYSGLHVLELGAGQSQELSTAGAEMLVLPLAGACVVECDGQRFELARRADVFSGVTDFAYLHAMPRPVSAATRAGDSRAGTIPQLRDALARAVEETGPVLVHVETDPLIPAPDSESWWDVPVAQISVLAATRDARQAYEAAKASQRPLLGTGEPPLTGPGSEEPDNAQ